MPTKQFSVVLLTALLVSGTAANGLAQKYQPFGPVDATPDFQIFDHADLGDFGERADANQGYFFSYERLNWIVGVPNRTSIGKRGLTLNIFDGASAYTQSNSIDNSVPVGSAGWGNRFDLGYMLTNDTGWLLSVLDGPRIDDRQFYGSPGEPSVSIVFADPMGLNVGFSDINGDGIDDDINVNTVYGRFGRDTTVPPDGTPDVPAATDLGDLVTFGTLFEFVTARNLVTVNGVELMHVRRYKPFHRGSQLELLIGARLMQFADEFNVAGTGGVLADSHWDTEAQNNMIGPQVGVRWFDKRGRWTFNLAGRFFAALNIQNLKQDGEIGSQIVSGAAGNFLNLKPTEFRHSRHETEFSPVAEMRVTTSYDVTRSCAVKVGWTGTYMGSIARSSSLVDYKLPNMGLLPNELQSLLMHGVNFGVEFNR